MMISVERHEHRPLPRRGSGPLCVSDLPPSLRNESEGEGCMEDHVKELHDLPSETMVIEIQEEPGKRIPMEELLEFLYGLRALGLTVSIQPWMDLLSD
jgi:hypothetical protein